MVSPPRSFAKYILVRILAGRCSQSSSERNWNVQQFLHSARRNKLSSEKLEKMTDIYVNSRLINKVVEVGYSDEMLDLPLETMFTRQYEADRAAEAQRIATSV